MEHRNESIRKGKSFDLKILNKWQNWNTGMKAFVKVKVSTWKIFTSDKIRTQEWKYLGKKKNFSNWNCPRRGQILPVRGWVSIDRSMVAALLLTTPRLVRKSSTDDLAPAHHTYKVGNTKRDPQKSDRIRDAKIRSGLVARVVPLWEGCTPQLTLPIDTQGTNGIVAVTRRDSDLEAFSRNPTDGSVAPLATRPNTWTKCPNLRFLSYWAGLLSQRQSHQ